MALVPKKGSLDSDQVIPSIEQSPLTVLEKSPEIFKSSNNANAINVSRSPELISSLKAFITGMTIKVTFYHQMVSTAEFYSAPSAVSFITDSVNTSFLKINNFEMKLQGDVIFSHAITEISSAVSGTAIVYPGLIPRIGDLFLYAVDTGEIGLFKITDNPERLSIRRNTAHRINFTLIKLLETEDKTLLEERVRDEAYFDKNNFILSPGSLLTHQNLVDVKYIDESYSKLLGFYDKFFSPRVSSFVLNDEIFDPYLVNFFRRTISTYSKNKYIEMPSPDKSLVNWNRSIYAFFMKENVLNVPLNTMVQRDCLYSNWSSLIYTLQGKQIIELTDLEDVLLPYISTNILAWDVEAYTDFDKLVSTFITQDAINYAALTAEIDGIYTASDEIQFFRIPIIMFLLSKVKESIMAGGTTKLVDTNLTPYLNIPFTALDVKNDILERVLPYRKVIALMDKNKEIIYIDNSIIHIVDGTISINLASILAAKGLEEVDGEWVMIVENEIAQTEVAAT